MTLHDIIEKIRMNSYTQYEIRVMLEELAKSQEQQQSPFVEDGLLAIPEEHIFEGLEKSVVVCATDDVETYAPYKGYKFNPLYDLDVDCAQFPISPKPYYIIETAKMLEGETFQQTIDRLGLKPIGEQK